MKIDFSQFKEGELVKCHQNDHNPVKWLFGTFHEDLGFTVFENMKRYYVEKGARRSYFYQNTYNDDCEDGEIRKITNAEKIMFALKSSKRLDLEK